MSPRTVRTVVNTPIGASQGGREGKDHAGKRASWLGGRGIPGIYATLGMVAILPRGMQARVASLGTPLSRWSV